MKCLNLLQNIHITARERRKFHMTLSNFVTDWIGLTRSVVKTKYLMYFSNAFKVHKITCDLRVVKQIFILNISTLFESIQEFEAPVSIMTFADNLFIKQLVTK